MRTPIFAGNWKMYTTVEQARQLAGAIAEGLSVRFNGAAQCSVIVCPPFVNIAAVVEVLSGSTVDVGAQNCWSEPYGAFTGEVSAEMLRAVGCRYVIIGHSERRSIFREDDSLIGAKLQRVWEAELVPILCIGETLHERQSGMLWEVLRRQLESVLPRDGSMRPLICAYEPVWAIGTGIAASAEEIQQAHQYIRAVLDAAGYSHAPIIYGGSVSPSNVAEILSLPHTSGVLVGSASLKAESFLSIIELGLHAYERAR